MALLAPAEQDKLREWFNEMTGPVRLLFFTQAIGCEACEQTRRILDELPPLSDRITIEEVNFVLDKDRASQFAVDRVPAVALLGKGANGAADRDTRIRFLGTPAGHEFMSLIQAVLLVGGAASQLSDANRRRISSVDKPVTMQVFSTPT